LKGALREAVRQVVTSTGCDVRFTVQQNLLFTGLREEQKDLVNSILRSRGVLDARIAAVLRQSMACPALPTCGQAITESERILPGWPKAFRSS